MFYPIECSDEYGLKGIGDAAHLAQWLNSWLQDDDVTECVIKKQPKVTQPYNPDDYTLAPAQAGEQQMSEPRYLRITKRKWYELGGFSNTNCFRRQRGSCWAYYVVIDNL